MRPAVLCCALCRWEVALQELCTLLLRRCSSLEGAPRAVACLWAEQQQPCSKLPGVTLAQVVPV